jgi:hypothetical protein
MATPSPGPNFTLLPNGNWVPKGSPLDTTSTATSTSKAATNPSAVPNQAQPAPSVAGQTPQGQAAAASYYSPNPQNTPNMTTSNQGAQNTVLNSYLSQATQGTNINMNDPVIRQQQNAFESANERTRRDSIADTAEAANAQGLGNSGALTAEDRLINEHAGQANSQFAAQLASNELANRRNEIQNALSGLSGIISGDQARMLQEELAKIEEKMGYADLALRGELGRGGLANERLGITNQNDQFNKRLGFDIGNAQMGYNRDALIAMMGGG